jgi:hypothetical protein
MATAAAGDDSYLAFDRRVGAENVLGLKVHFDEVGVSRSHAFQLLVDNIVNGID